MRTLPWRPSKPVLFTTLMLSAGFVSLLPTHWTGCTDGLTQPISPITWIFTSGTRAVQQTADDLLAPEPDPATYATLLRENELLHNQVGQQAILISELHQVIADLSGLRGQLDDLQTRIIFASVIGRDTSPMRETLTISKGSRHGIEVGDWVTAGLPPNLRDQEATGRELLLQQWLIGTVYEVQPFISRIQLATDPEFEPQLAWVAKPLTDNTWAVAEASCSVIGAGGGRMRLDRASYDYLGNGYTIVLAPLAPPRPLVLALGKIVSCTPLETGLHYDFEVAPWGEAVDVKDVYVISVSE